MNELDALEMLLKAYSAPSVVVGFITLKGVAAVINNNVSTKRWWPWLRKSIDWLASADKKGKEMGDRYSDATIELVQDYANAEKKNVVQKVLKYLS